MNPSKTKTTSVAAFQHADGPIEHKESWLVNDAWIASQLQMKPSTIRAQRHKRKNGQPHWLTLDPVLIGTKPRYVRADVEKWLQGAKS